MTKLKEKAFWIAFGDVGGRGFSLLTTIYLARVLGPEYYGLITVAISVLGYATWFSDLGLQQIGVRETAKKPSKRVFRVLEIFRLRMFLGIAVLIASIIIISMIDAGEIEKQVILGYLYSLIPFMALMEWFYAGKQEFGKIALSKVLNGLAYFLLVFMLIENAEDVTMVPVLYTTGVVIAAFTLGTFAIKDKPFTLSSRGLQVYPDLLKTSSILGLGNFFAQVVQLLPPLLVGALFSLHDAGIYGAAFKIVLIAMMIDRVFVNLLLPNLSSLWSKNRSLVIEKIEIVYRAVLAGGSLLGLMTALGAEQIITMFYGNSYEESVLILQVLSILITVTFINSLFSYGLIATNNDKKFFIASCFGGTISAFMIFGAAAFGDLLMVSSVVALAEIVITFCTYFWFRTVIPSSYIKPLIKSYSLAIGLFIIFNMSPWMPILNALIASLIFVVVIFKTGVIDKQHLSWLKTKLSA